MRVSIMASDGNILCQGSALREGFAALGHEHTAAWAHPDTAFAFIGNPPFAPYLDAARSREKKLIFNVLDCPTWVTQWPAIQQAYRDHLPLASRVTCISKTVQRDLIDLCGIQSEVIYYPMKAVHHTGGKPYPQFKVAMVGRVSDPNKRTAAAVKALIRAGYNESEVVIVGPERAGWGTHMGVVSDEVLNDVYNSVDYVMMLSKNEGIGLPAIEAACCGAIPIVAPSLSTYDEFWADSPLGIFYPRLTSIDEVAKLMIALNGDAAWKATVKQDIRAYADTHFRPLFDRKAVASRIMSVYQSL
jgi:hypothetical protein